MKKSDSSWQVGGIRSQLLFESNSSKITVGEVCWSYSAFASDVRSNKNVLNAYHTLSYLTLMPNL
jgi:hypothetical protein